MTDQSHPRTALEVDGAGDVQRQVRPGRVLPWILLGGLAFLLGSFTGPVEGHAGPNASLRIGVAPFEGERGEREVSERLSERIAALGVERLLGPAELVAARELDPRAELIRTWARQSELDAIVVGRVERSDSGDAPREVLAVVRSGHSGAELFRHAVQIARGADVDAALDRLAAAIVRDLGGDPEGGTASPGSGSLPSVSANAAADPAADPVVAGPVDEPEQGAKQAPAAGAGGVRSGSGLETRLGVAKFRSDAPIEIDADAAELTAVGDDRKLVFQGSVRVRQDNVTLTSERLEAEYVDGASEPSRLLAEGSVHVQQNDRAARCDRAEYLRSTQQITCRGHAELLQGCDVVRGELIVLDLAADRARVEGAASIVINPKPREGQSCLAPGGRP